MERVVVDWVGGWTRMSRGRRIACVALTQLRVEITAGREGSPTAGVGEGAVREALVRIAESMLAFGPSVAFDATNDVVWVDVGGCAHLHGGEGKLAHAIGECVARQGHACRVAVAEGPRIASAVARFGTRSACAVVPEGQGAEAVRVLPVAALGLDESVRGWLGDLGLRTCGDLQKLPRRTFALRLGALAPAAMQFLDGHDAAPFVPWRPPEVPEESIELEWGAPSVEALAFVVRALCDRLSVRLGGRAMAATRLDLDLGLDRALSSSGSAGETISVVVPAPLSHARDLFAVVRARLERHTLAGPVLRATLRAFDLVAKEGRARDLFAAEPKHEATLTPLVAELSAELGDDRVGTLGIVDTWHPCERTRLLPFRPKRETVAAEDRRTSFHPLETTALEPSRLWRGARVCGPTDSLSEPSLLVRTEAVEWWRGSAPRRDMIAAFVRVGGPQPPSAWGSGHPSGALGWFEVGGDPGGAVLRGWVD